MAGVEVTAESRPATPLWWLLFSAGGVMSAFFMPVTVFLTSIAVAADWLDEEELLDAVRHPLGRAYLFMLVSLSLFHGSKVYFRSTKELVQSPRSNERPCLLTWFTCTRSRGNRN